MARIARRSWTSCGPGLAIVACLIVLPGLVGCAAAAAPATPPAPGQPASSAAAAPTPAPAGSPGVAPSPPLSPSDAALQLESLLGQHAVLAADLMRGRLRNDEDFGQAADAAVGKNTDDLAGLVGSLYGEQQADRFRTLWADHVTALFNYSRGLATGDNAVRDDSMTKLVDFEGNLADFFSSASQGRLDRDAARAAAQAHVDHLTQQADAYAAGDYQRADQLYRESYAHAFELGHTLAATLLPPDQAAVLTTPAWQLRSEMARLLGEHGALALATLRSGATASPDFMATTTALDGNTTDVTAAVSSLFGEPAASQFMGLWADHLDQIVGYAGDVAAKRENRRDAVEGSLHGWQQRFATFIDAATGSRVAAPALASQLVALDDLLLRQVDTFAAKDFKQAQDLAGQVSQDVFGLSQQLADAFGATIAARMPQGGARTGGGGMAGALVQPVPAAPAQARAPAPELPPATSFRSVRAYQEVALPVRLRIPAARIDTPLEQLGRAADQTVEVPADFGVAGWFDGGPRPGQDGPAVILGHVDSRRGPGVFFGLAGLAPGADVLVDRADGSTVTFRVSSVQKVPKTGFPTEQVYGPTLQSSLRLVTCGGEFDQAAGSYRDNVIVTADPAR